MCPAAIAGTARHRTFPVCGWSAPSLGLQCAEFWRGFRYGRQNANGSRRPGADTSSILRGKPKIAATCIVTNKTSLGELRLSIWRD
jgi:hypothetical protein